MEGLRGQRSRVGRASSSELRYNFITKIEELEKNPFLGEKLGKRFNNRFNIDLTGFLKVYVASKKFRIVYRLLSPEKVEIIEIWGIGKREKEEIYRTIGRRLGQ